MSEVRIRCPKCEWEPDGKPHWQCTCSYTWDIFATAGRCPSCGKIWQETQCVTCHQWSPHLDWYDGLDDIIQKLKEEIEAEWARRSVTHQP